MQTIYDQRTDKSQAVFYRAIAKLADTDFAERTKTMLNEVHTREKTAAETDPVFASPELQKFPVHTLEDTVVSKLYFDHQRDKLAEHQEAAIGAKLDTYLNLYEVPEALFARAEEKTAEAAEPMAPRYLLPSLQLCKVASETDMEKAADLFVREHRNLCVSERVEFAVNFIKAATELGTSEYPEAIAKYAGVLDTDMENINAMLEVRAAAASRKGLSGALYTKLAFDLKQVEQPPTRQELVKLAQVIHDLDEAHGLTGEEYDRQMPCAYATVFSKAAAAEPTAVDTPPSKAEIVAQYGEDALEALEDETGDIDADRLNQLTGVYGAA